MTKMTYDKSNEKRANDKNSPTYDMQPMQRVNNKKERLTKKANDKNNKNQKGTIQRSKKQKGTCDKRTNDKKKRMTKRTNVNVLPFYSFALLACNCRKLMVSSFLQTNRKIAQITKTTKRAKTKGTNPKK